MSSDSQAATARPWLPTHWKRSALWAACLAPFFYGTYDLANWLASQRAAVASILFEWERQIPFLAWTVIPYWAIVPLYGLSLFVTASSRELDTLGRRLVTAQVIAVACFIALPLQFSFARPETSGLSGFLFDALTTFDRPFNQAPSLHVALLVILWSHYLRHVPRVQHWAVHGCGCVIGLSVLTTYQHHFIDVPTGALLGWLAVWLWPDWAVSPLQAAALTADRYRHRLALGYALGAALLAAIGFRLGGVWLWFLWPAVSLTLVALIYLAIGPAGFQKGADGKLSPAAHTLLAPYLCGARINSRLRTRRRDAFHFVRDGVWIGRLPTRREVQDGRFAGVVDLCAELNCRVGDVAYRCVPALDLVPVQADALTRAAHDIENLRQRGDVLVACALGVSRSAAAVAAWLLVTGRAKDPAEALAVVRQARPQVVFDPAMLAPLSLR
jgi:protein-tyrosine phosphatase/membrane-associated phospholipid phosphatase